MLTSSRMISLVFYLWDWENSLASEGGNWGGDPSVTSPGGGRGEGGAFLRNLPDVLPFDTAVITPLTQVGSDQFGFFCSLTSHLSLFLLNAHGGSPSRSSSSSYCSPGFRYFPMPQAPSNLLRQPSMSHSSASSPSSPSSLVPPVASPTPTQHSTEGQRIITQICGYMITLRGSLVPKSKIFICDQVEDLLLSSPEALQVQELQEILQDFRELRGEVIKRHIFFVTAAPPVFPNPVAVLPQFPEQPAVESVVIVSTDTPELPGREQPPTTKLPVSAATLDPSSHWLVSWAVSSWSCPLIACNSFSRVPLHQVLRDSAFLVFDGGPWYPSSSCLRSPGGRRRCCALWDVHLNLFVFLSLIHSVLLSWCFFVFLFGHLVLSLKGVIIRPCVFVSSVLFPECF